ncbi:MAG: hypothetical protein IIC76_06740 [Bacteroidetes bacterium]|nr:hypothetical protein [Bacteroidota bacterium]
MNSLILKPVYLAFFVLKQDLSKVLCETFTTLNHKGKKKILKGNKDIQNHKVTRDRKEIIPQEETLFPKKMVLSKAGLHYFIKP